MRTLLLLFAAVFLAGCESDDLPGADAGMLETDIEFYAREIHPSNDPSEPVLTLSFSTTKIYPCYNYYLDIEHSVEDQELTVVFRSIGQVEICLTALGPARGLLELPQDIKRLKLVRGETTDVYEVSINEERVELHPVEANFSKLVHERTYRAPEDSFAVVCGTNLQDTGLCDDFNNLILEIPGITEFEFEGVGLRPYPDSSSGNWNNTASRFFLYQEDAAFLQAGALLKDFTAEHIEPNKGNTIAIVGWDNRKFYSWLIK